jgi:hypothetical protein
VIQSSTPAAARLLDVSGAPALVGGLDDPSEPLEQPATATAPTAIIQTKRSTTRMSPSCPALVRVV